MVFAMIIRQVSHLFFYPPSNVLISFFGQYERTTDLEDRRWATRLARSMACDDEEDEEYMEGICNEQQMYKVWIGGFPSI
jgi:hypothetical protein